MNPNQESLQELIHRLDFNAVQAMLSEFEKYAIEGALSESSHMENKPTKTEKYKI